MTFLGHTDGIKAYKFMCKNNQVYHSATALFDENVFPRCKTQKQRETTRINEPESAQPPIEPQPTPSGIDDDDWPPRPWPDALTPSKQIKPKEEEEELEYADEPDQAPPPRPPRSPQRQRQPLPFPETPPQQGDLPLQPGSLSENPPMTPTPSQRARTRASGRPEPPDAPRRSKRSRKVTTRPDNVYGEDRPPSEIE